MNNEKTYQVTTEYGTYTVKPEVSYYDYGGGVCVDLHCWNKDDECWEPFTCITVNVPDQFLPTTVEEMQMAPVNTSNNNWVEHFLKDNDLATKTGRTVTSGFNTYPIYKFDLDKLTNEQ